MVDCPLTIHHGHQLYMRRVRKQVYWLNLVQAIISLAHGFGVPGKCGGIAGDVNDALRQPKTTISFVIWLLGFHLAFELWNSELQ